MSLSKGSSYFMIFTTTETATSAEGLVDLAVNVRLSAPPDWLTSIINSTTQDLAAYPNTDAATKAIAAAHGVTVDQVLPTAGGAEAFTLLARALRPNSR